MYTRHGHHIDGTEMEPVPPSSRARCGGPGLCEQCSQEAFMVNNYKETSMSQIETTTYVRKPFEVEAVEVTDANIERVAEWCQGTLMVEENGRQFIKVRVARALNERQTKAYTGDWVLYAGTGFKVYTPKAFAKTFVKQDNGQQELFTTTEPATSGEQSGMV